MSTNTSGDVPRYSSAGWTHWPDHQDFSFQFARALGGVQEDAGTVSEIMQVGSRIPCGDTAAWHAEWTRVADVNRGRAVAAAAAGNLHTAKSNWMRAANYYRSAEFFLSPDDPQRLTTFDKVEACTREYLARMEPAGEVIKVDYEEGSHLDGYFIRAPYDEARQPTIIAFGGLDEYKDEVVHEMCKFALPRGFSLMIVDLPGQGGTLRRQGIKARHDAEVPVGRVVDYLLTRPDVDPDRIVLYGASLGGHYSARAAAFETRLKAAVNDGGMWDLHRFCQGLRARPESLLIPHLEWVLGVKGLEAVIEKTKPFRLEGIATRIKMPYLFTFGEADFLGLREATEAREALREAGVDLTFKMFTVEETGASHCQCDNPTLGQEVICDWLANQLGLDQAAIAKKLGAVFY
jgi:dienelactone hydrolase